MKSALAEIKREREEHREGVDKQTPAGLANLCRVALNGSCCQNDMHKGEADASRGKGWPGQNIC